MAPPRKKPLPPGTKPPAPRKPSLSGTASGTHKSSSHRSASKSSAAAATAAAQAALSAATTSTKEKSSKPKSKPSRHVVDTSILPPLERMDNGMRFSSFPIVYNINQKNYYTDYLKKDDQVPYFGEVRLK